jgi:hypothetical protein
MSTDAGTDTIELGGREYRWTELDVPITERGRQWWHPGIVAAADGSLRLVDQLARRLITVDPAGAVIASVAIPHETGHGLAIDPPTGGTWIADPGSAATVDGGVVHETESPGFVSLVDERGRPVIELPTPDVNVYRTNPYRPTAVALVSDPAGPSADAGQVWVADGYGQNLVHRYGRDGGYLGTIEGIAAGGPFLEPHALLVDDRGPEPRVLVADRAHHAIRVFDRHGAELDRIDTGAGTLPSALAHLGEQLLIVDLNGGVLALDPDGSLGAVGRSGRTPDEPGWPNRVDPAGAVEPPGAVAGAFNSPHGIAVAADGRVIVAEWLLGGRLIVLEPAGG